MKNDGTGTKFDVGEHIVAVSKAVIIKNSEDENILYIPNHSGYEIFGMDENYVYYKNIKPIFIPETKMEMTRSIGLRYNKFGTTIKEY